MQLALARAMAEDESVLVIGEDVGVNGGVFRATDGSARALRAGAGVRYAACPRPSSPAWRSASAAQGFRPVVEFQFMGFIYPAIDQLVNHASRLRTRTQGRLTCPIVIRAPYGGGIHAPEHHSESAEAMFAQIPGLRVVIPSSSAKAYGLLLAAIRDPDPVVFLEPKRMPIARPRRKLPTTARGLPLDRCFVRTRRAMTSLWWPGAP